jgi:hypothetical protein
MDKPKELRKLATSLLVKKQINYRLTQALNASDPGS